MTDLFTHRRDVPSCPWIKESHLGKCSNEKLRTSTLVNDRTLISIKSTADFASALSNINNVISSLCSHPKINCRELQDYENIHGGDSFLMAQKKSLVEVSLHFHLQLLQKHTWMATTMARKSNKPVPEQVK